MENLLRAYRQTTSNDRSTMPEENCAHVSLQIDLNFELNVDYIGQDFFKADVNVDKERHVIFASDDMYTLLSRSRHW